MNAASPITAPHAADKLEGEVSLPAPIAGTGGGSAGERAVAASLAWEAATAWTGAGSADQEYPSAWASAWAWVALGAAACAAGVLTGGVAEALMPHLGFSGGPLPMAGSLGDGRAGTLAILLGGLALWHGGGPLLDGSAADERARARAEDVARRARDGELNHAAWANVLLDEAARAPRGSLPPSLCAAADGLADEDECLDGAWERMAELRAALGDGGAADLIDLLDAAREALKGGAAVALDGEGEELVHRAAEWAGVGDYQGRRRTVCLSRGGGAAPRGPRPPISARANGDVAA